MRNESPERWKRIEAVVDVVLDTPPADRERVLDEICANDPALRREVAELLDAGERAGSRFDRLEVNPLLIAPDGFLARLRLAVGDRYEIEREIGGGGMAVVFLARDRKHDRQVALKVLRPELLAGRGAHRFLREVEIVAKLHHSHILTLLDSGGTDDLLYYVVPYVPGGSLRQRLGDERQLSIAEALRIAREVADGLAYAHARAVVHRDIKPENILLSDGHAFIADFGIARALSVSGTLTSAGDFIGTPLYMSPEQAGDTEAVDARADVYSLGCVLFEMLAGEPPFTGPTRQAIIAKHALEPVPRLRHLRESVPAALEAVVQDSLAKVPADRYANGEELAAALDRVAAALPQDVRGHVLADRRGRERAAHPDSGQVAGVRRFWADARRRKVHRAAVMYMAAAFGILGTCDLLNLVGVLSDGVYRLVGILVLAGFPAAMLLAWTFDITRAGILRTPRLRGVRSGTGGSTLLRGAGELAVGVALTIGLALLIVRLLVSTADPVPDYLVQAHRTDATTAAEAEYALIAAEALTRLLTGWEEARAVPSVALPRLRKTLGLSDPVRSDLDESLALAGAAGAGTLITVTVGLRADTSFIEASLFRVKTGSAVGLPLRAAAESSRIMDLVAPLAAEILGLSGAPEQIRALLAARPSENLQALRQLRPGIESLNQWRLQSAERQFRAALALDSTLSLAHHYLGVTLWARVMSDEISAVGVGGEVRRHTSAAVRHGHDLPHRDSLHAVAFNAFQTGAYDRAREIYRALVDSDPSDTYAWLLLGSVEVHDPWAVARADGTVAPRGNLNTAMRAFTRTVRLSPDFFLGYAPLFNLFLQLSAAMRAGHCPGFEPPGNRTVLIWDERNPETQVYFCPVLRDSVGWVSASDLDLAAGSAFDGAAEFLDQAFRELARWAEYAPDDPKPREEMARWLLARRQALPWTGRGTAQDTLARQALVQLESALALRTDTLPADLIRIASLYLSADEPNRALALTERAIGRIDDSTRGAAARLPLEAANAYLAAGRLSAALELLSSPSARQMMAAPDTVTGQLVPFGVEPALTRIAVHGATGLVNEQTRADLESMERTWAQLGYDERRIRIIKEYVTSDISLALVIDDSLRTLWFRDMDVVAPLWRGFLADDRATKRQWLDRAVAEADRGVPNPIETWEVAMLARDSGEDSVAIELLDRFDRLPLPLDRYSGAWGLHSLSHLYRAQSSETLGDVVAARTHYQRFVELWDSADPELQHLVRQARAGLTRVR